MPKKSSVPTEVRYNSHFASVLRQKMAEKGTTQKELAEFVGIRPQTLTMYCTGETQPTIEKAIKVAEYYGLTIDYLLTGNYVDDIPVWDTLGLTQNTVENMKLVKEGYFSDAPQLIYTLNYMLGDHDFYMTMVKACKISEKKATIERQQQEFEEQHKNNQYGYVEERQEYVDALELQEYKMGKLFMDYFTNFINHDYKKMYYRTEWDKGTEETDSETIAREEAEMEKGMAAYKAAHPEPESTDDLIAEMAADNGADNGET